MRRNMPKYSLYFNPSLIKPCDKDANVILLMLSLLKHHSEVKM